MVRRERRRPGVAVCLAFLAVLLAVPATAFGQDADTAAADASALEGALLEYGPSAVSLRVLRFGPVLLGVFFALVWLRRWRDRQRRGLAAPHGNEPLVPFGGVASVWLSVAALIIVPAVVVVMYMVAYRVDDPRQLPIWISVVASALGSLPVAFVIVVRRHRMVHTPPAERVSTGGVFAPPAGAMISPMPRGGVALRIGFRALCLASLLSLPVAYLWSEVLTALGQPPDVQNLVKEVVESTSSSTPWVIAVFGVLVAPFVEESIFRGLLYPVVKRAAGGGRRGVWIGATVVSLLFAAVHLSWFAFLPLFALAMVLNFVFEKTNSLAAVVVAHALHNLFAMIPLFVYRMGQG
jgi:membrane protease YdiL (CAAX protease family)